MNYKEELIYGIAGTISIIIITFFFVLNYQRRISNFQPVTNNQLSGNQNNTVNPNPLNGTILTADEIAKHNSEKDCWLIIDNNVYDVTNYLFLHPGGVSNITQYCGTNGTTGYVTKGGKGSHSFRANGILKLLLLGALKGPVINQPSNIQQNLLQLPQGGRNNDD